MYITDVITLIIYILILYIFTGDFAKKVWAFFNSAFLETTNTLPSLYMVQRIFGVCNTNWFLGCTPATFLFSTSTSISISFQQSPCMITETSSYFLDEYR